VIAGVAVAPIATAQRPQVPQSAQVDRLFAEWDDPTSPGAALAVVHDGVVLHRKGYGSANLEHRVPITPSTVFDIASVSKQFTGMAIAMLVERGDISLDDDIRNYLTEVPAFGGRTITVRHLVHHTSGLRDWPGTLAVAGWQMDDVISFEQILTMVRHQQGLNFEPGAEYLYSNTGYNLLAELVRRVSGRSFRSWTDANILRPLGMLSSHIHDDHLEVVPNRAYAYRPDDSGFHAVPNGLTALGSSSLFSTVEDLAKWLANFDEPTVGGTGVVGRMLERGVVSDGERIAYAYGVIIGEYRGARTIGHSGSWAGFRTQLIHFPEHCFGVVVLSNLATFNPARKAYAVADIYLGKELAPTEASAPDGPTTPPSRDVLDRYVGSYRLGAGWVVTITREGDTLMTQATAEDKFPMTPRAETEFHVDAYGASIHFRPAADGSVDTIRYRGIVAPRVEPYEPERTELYAYVGEYRSEELSTTYTITLEEDRLVARHRRHGVISLIPVLRDEFRGGTWFLRGVEFDRDTTGEVVGLRVTNGRSRNLRFIRAVN
jgi:CubicO group peptidase (beta-lactamase class C family)